MLARALRHATFANVCSFLALTVALGTGTAYAANTIRSADIVNGQVKRQDLAENSVNAAKLAADAVDSTKIAADTITSEDVAPSTLTADELATNSVGATEIADSSIDAGEVVDNSLGAADLSTSSVTVDELASNAVTSSEVANNTITPADLRGSDLSGGLISLGAGAVANGRCSAFNVGINGGTPGEAVIFSVQSTLPSGILIYGQQVVSASAVQAYVCNFSGGTMPAITDLPVRIITFG